MCITDYISDTDCFDYGIHGQIGTGFTCFCSSCIEYKNLVKQSKSIKLILILFAVSPITRTVVLFVNGERFGWVASVSKAE